MIKRISIKKQPHTNNPFGIRKINLEFLSILLQNMILMIKKDKTKDKKTEHNYKDNIIIIRQTKKP